jgi:hypothetical protein
MLISDAGTLNGGTFDGYADGRLVTVGVNQYMLNYNDTSGSKNFGDGEHANYMRVASSVSPLPRPTSAVSC